MILRHLITTILVALSVSTLPIHAQNGLIDNAALQNIMTRCSIRTFENKPVEDNKVETLLRAGMAAPSSRNMQPWHLVVVKGQEAINKLADQNPHHGDQIRQTPLIIYVCGDTARFQPGEARDYWIEDCSAVSENILLAAHAMGLGAVWTSVYPSARKVNGIRRNLGLSEAIVPFSMIRIGYPGEPADVKDKWDPEKITYWK